MIRDHSPGQCRGQSGGVLYSAAGGSWSRDRSSSHKGNAGELHCQWWRCSSVRVQYTPLYSDASALIASDPRFEVLVEQKLDHLSGQPVSVSTNSIDFRVTGTIEYGVSVEEASAIHGIDFNRMNRELAKRVNGCSGPVSILPSSCPRHGLQVCRHALSEGAPFLPVFEVVCDVAKRLIDEFYRAVGYCKCGM